MPDYMFLLESRLLAEQKAALERIQSVAQSQGVNIYLAGGAVRDLITGLPIRDLDFIVEGNPFRVAHELAKHGARILEEEEEHRHVEIVFAGEVDGSVSAAREEIYDYPGTPPRIRWSTAMDDLKRRDFSINAVAISLNPASRGLVLDPTNGLADLEQNHEIRVLSIHSFTNRPVRLLRAIRYATRLGFKLETRTAEWFALAMERGHNERIPAEDVGREVRQLTVEDKAVAILTAWERQGLAGVIHPNLARRHPDYKGLAALQRARESMFSVGIRLTSADTFAPVIHYLLGRLKSGDRTRTIHRMGFRKSEQSALENLEKEAEKIVKVLKTSPRKLLPKGKGAPKGKVAEARALYDFLEATPRGLLAFILAEYSQPAALSRIRMYLNKWKPLRMALPAAELEAMGLARGPQFDTVLENLFNLQLVGRGRNPQDRTKLLRKLAGIKPEAKKKEEKKKEEKKPKAKAAPAQEAKPGARLEGKAPVPPPAAPPAKGKPAAKQEAPPVATGKPAAKEPKKKTPPPKAHTAARKPKPAKKKKGRR
jgi:tRNA nucleotidyltransferase/poly(A) polymerase